MTEAELCKVLRGIEAAHARVTGDDDPGRAKRAIDDICRQLADARTREQDVECSYGVQEESERILLIALCCRYGLKPFRRPRARATTISVLAPRLFVDAILSPEFIALAAALRLHLSDVTRRVLRGAFPETVPAMPEDVEEPPSVNRL